MPKNPHAQALGTLGGKARAKNTTPEQRKKWAYMGGRPLKLHLAMRDVEHSNTYCGVKTRTTLDPDAATCKTCVENWRKYV